MKPLRPLIYLWLPIIIWMGFIYIVSADSNPFRAFPNAHEAPAVKPSAAEPKPTAGGSAPQTTAAVGDVTEVVGKSTRTVRAVTVTVRPPVPAGRADLPNTALRPGYEALGRLAHAGEYALLSFLLARALSRSGFDPRIRGGREALLALAFGLAFCYGLGDEIHQISVAGRTFQGVDLTLDALGAAAGVLIYVKMGSFSSVRNHGGQNE